MKYEKSNSKFRFGNPTVYNSIHKVTIPATIGSKNVLISADVIDLDIPLLISKDAMKKSNTVINFRQDNVQMFGETIRVRFTSTGHYCVCLNKYIDVCYYGVHGFNVYFTNLEKIDNCTVEEKKRIAVKLHKQFCHATGKRLKQLLISARIRDKEMLKIIETVSENCAICQRYKRSSPKPIVSMPLAKIFNEHIAMDLKDIGSKKIIHLVDHVTRFSAAAVIPSKKRDVVIDAVLRIWVSIFGSPKKILSDNGGEFTNDDFAEMAEKLNTKITTTAAESPWSNGVNERHNGILGEMVLKTMEDTHCSIETALMWSVTAKNTLANVYGFSPSQLVFGRNGSFPSVIHDKLPALDNNFSTEYMRKNLDVLHSARENYVKAESSDKLRRALRLKTRTHTAKLFEIGQSVYFKREDSSRWKGPGDVIGVQGETVVIKYGGNIVRVHSCRVQLENTEFFPEDKTSEIDASAPVKEKDELNAPDESHNTDTDNDKLKIQTQKTVTREDTQDVEIQDDENEEGSGTVTENEMINVSDGQATNNVLPKVKSMVLAKISDEDDFKQLKIISRAGKASSAKYSTWLNVQDVETQEISPIDWKNVQEWKELPVEEVLISNGYNPDELLSAKFEEIKKWKDYDVYTEVENVGQKVISTRWVNTVKDGIIRSRLVARGYEDTELNERIDSPTCEKSNLRLAVAIAASKQWRVNSLDVQSAFLQGKEVEGDIYLRPPKEVNTKLVWKLKNMSMD